MEAFNRNIPGVEESVISPVVEEHLQNDGDGTISLQSYKFEKPQLYISKDKLILKVNGSADRVLKAKDISFSNEDSVDVIAIDSRNGRITNEVIGLKGFKDVKVLSNSSSNSTASKQLHPLFVRQSWYVAAGIDHISTSLIAMFFHNALNLGLNLSSMGSLVTGVLHSVEGLRIFDRGLRIGDSGSVSYSIFKILRGVFEELSALTYTVIQILEMIQKCCGSVTASQVAAFLTQMRIPLMLVLYLGVIIPVSMSLIRSIKLLVATKTNGSVDSVQRAYKNLLDILQLSEDDWSKSAKFLNVKNNAELISLFKKDVSLSKEEQDILSAEDIEKASSYVADRMKDMDFPNNLDKNYAALYFRIVLLEKISKIKMQREEKLVRRIGRGGVTALKSAFKEGVLGRESDKVSLDKMEGVIKIGRSQAKKSVFLSTIILSVILFAVLIAVVFPVLLPATPLLIMGILHGINYLTSIVALCVDSYFWRGGIGSLGDNDGSIDRRFIVGFILFSIVCTSISVVLAGGSVPLIVIAILLGVVMTSVQFSSLAISLSKRKRDSDDGYDSAKYVEDFQYFGNRMMGVDLT